MGDRRAEHSPDLAMLYPDQCCAGYCVGDLLHDLRIDQAERFIEVMSQARAEALREAASDPALRLSGHSGVSITRLRKQADALAGEGHV